MQTIIGTLTDNDIRQAIDKDKLISEYDETCIKQACYELRASNIYYLPEEGNTQIKLTSEEYILLKPHSIVVIITIESIKLPDDMLGRILTKGSLFSLGISAVNTYADPGFQGRLGIVFQNHSNQYLKINQGAQIAKMEFAKLHQKVKSPYHGQHGYDTEIWPLKKELILRDEEIKDDKRIKGYLEEIDNSYGPKMGYVIRRVLILEKRMLIASVLYFLFTFIILGVCFYNKDGIEGVITPLASVLVGVGSNILYGIVMFMIGNK